MIDSYNTVISPGAAQVIEKRSRFIAKAVAVADAGEAAGIIADVRSEHFAAKHNVFAYILRGTPVVERYSDDAEPQGTAGMPILEVLRGAGLENSMIVVTRYFGGVLLGTGGLSRAYSSAASEALKAAKTVKMSLFCNMTLGVDYNRYGRLPAMIAEFGGRVISSDFADDVTVSFSLPYKKEAEFCAALTELSCGSLTPQKTGECFLPE